MAFNGWQNCLVDEAYVPPIPERRYIAGGAVDNDDGCIVVIDAETKGMVRIRYCESRMRNFERIVKVAFAEYHPAVIWVDVSGIGNLHVEALQSEGLPVRGTRITSRSHWNMFEDLVRAVRGKQIKLLPDSQFLDALIETEVISTPTHERFATPPDRKVVSVVATALAWHGVTHYGARIDFV